MPRTPTVVAPATPVPAPTPPPAPVVSPTTLSPVTRRPRPARTVPPARMAYVRHATAGDSDDRIIANALSVFYKVMAWAGGVAILILILFGGFKLGRATAPSSNSSAPTNVNQPAPTPAPAPAPAPGWQSRGFPTRDDCEYHFVVVLHEAPGSRCQ
ncbi:MAG: hypothetical protein A2655_04710 [Candidatus Yanofskybacteria bacterium RIFCSPHIGHO2_01_FULL_43_42]|uniref:Uncharacterized protein n=1 Tax=Candidatus Yanofskybacteria bacterium RIFCSPLOWO2_01_FULL_43_22 TaxID=1802695 RepID=A0A1F8GFN3_9BACT|nr:MAG: hypothetical protein A2655_04710 [Candidatus Yanofskybacteria bacterium RIFCSPHIGHO2_01_FULL_43_42]OGN12795.1 MAG: hypothetical protein A3D48_00925 [Candidatus Yanofskybacteria bacterium RIFCSPHIGHO2_02_FULL_43_17]OGN23870.1 MAG: hypothetical protein A3A13_02150 [Candidatus Yanofskybacteria bacterium RIFCSPLOWO2_01_FULL_43_22]